MFALSYKTIVFTLKFSILCLQYLRIVSNRMAVRHPTKVQMTQQGIATHILRITELNNTRTVKQFYSKALPYV